MKKLIALSLIACMAVSTAACGSSSKDTAAAETTDAAEETTDTAEETADAADTEASDKTWVIAMDTVFRPFEYTDEDNDFVGIDVDIIKAIAQDQNFKIDIQSLGWDAAVAAVQSGQADGLIAGASITEERQANGWIFSDSYFDSCQIFAVAAGSDIDSFEDLAGKNVAVKNGTQGAAFAESLKDQYGFTTTVFEDSPTMYQDVVAGNSVACVEDKPIIQDWIANKGLGLKVVDSMESDPAPYGFAIMNEANQELLDMFNAGLADIKANGTYDEILAKYLGE
ncbi:transporter substrate-binding domain-containing protein [Clostridiaceae bacterium Marseille-Q4145]|nr:transporter substrate-binding domain-containing protein [Clostridiaceae bacterium Marseille-Q4145]